MRNFDMDPTLKPVVSMDERGFVLRADERPQPPVLHTDDIRRINNAVALEARQANPYVAFGGKQPGPRG